MTLHRESGGGSAILFGNLRTVSQERRSYGTPKDRGKEADQETHGEEISTRSEPGWV